jgi:RNA polymerase sigma factor (sigma-70 family)
MTHDGTTGLLRRLRELAQNLASESTPDGELLERYLRTGNVAGFSALLTRHGPMVWNVCWRLLHHREDVEDAFQACFLLLARRGESIRKQSSVGSWLHGVAYRVAQTIRRTRGRVPAAARMVDEPDVLEELSAREAQVLLHEELDRLPERLRAPLVLCFLEGQTQEAVARQLGWSISTLRRRLNRGRNVLRPRLARRGLTLSGALAAGLLADTTHAAVPAILRVVTEGLIWRLRAQPASLSIPTKLETIMKSVILGAAPLTRRLVTCLCAGVVLALSVALHQTFCTATPPELPAGESAAAPAQVELPPPGGEPGNGEPVAFLEVAQRPGKEKPKLAEGMRPGAFKTGGKEHPHVVGEKILEFKNQFKDEASISYNVKFKAGATYQIDMIGTDPAKLDPYLILKDANDKELARDDDGGGNFNARIVYRATTGGSYQIVATWIAKGEGPYTLTVREKDSTQTVGPKGLEIKGQFNKEKAIPYTVKLQEGKTYQIDMVRGNQHTLDPFLILKDPSGKEVAKDDDSGGNLNARIIYMAKTGGNYQVIATWINNGVGDYTLTVREKDSAHEVGPKGLTIKGQLKNEKFIPYIVKLEKGKTYQIDMIGANQKTLDPYLFLKDPGGKEVARDDDSGGNLNARILYTAKTSGNYQVQAAWVQHGVGEFTLTVREIGKKQGRQ